MQVERISIQNFLRASEIFLRDHNSYSLCELALMSAMLKRLSAKMNKTKDKEDRQDS